MGSLFKPPVHLWVYNHPFVGISDQIGFVSSCLRQHGYPVSIGRRPSPSSLNMVIENFSPGTRDELIGFCTAAKKRVAVIMTEHMDFRYDHILFHGEPLGTDSEYMHRTAQYTRVRYLIECLPHIRCFFVLADLPRLSDLSSFLPGVESYSFPFPRIADTTSEASEGFAYDLTFTGAMTDYRRHILARLRSAGLSVRCPEVFVSRHRRNAMNRSAKIVLNIPQRENWRWLSPMRIIAALHTRRATVSLGRAETSAISTCCTELDMEDPGWISRLRRCVEDWKSLYVRDAMDYAVMAKAFEEQHPFPHDVLELWSFTDRVWARAVDSCTEAGETDLAS